MKIYWVGNTSIPLSETFVIDTLQRLKNIGEVEGLCGMKPSSAVDIPFFVEKFSNPKERLHEKLVRKLIGRNVYYRRIDRAFGRRTKGLFNGESDAIVYLEFGSTAALLSESMMASELKYYVAVHGIDLTAMMQIEEYRTRFVQACVHPNCGGVICASQHTKRLAILAGIPQQKCHVIRYALDGVALCRNSDIVKTEQPSFVHLGRLTEKKHPLATLEAFRLLIAKVPNATLTFIGEGPMKHELEKRIAANCLSDSVSVKGAMPHAEAMRYVQSQWVFVQHSVTARNGDQEGFAISPAEAALMELPVVSTIHNGIPEHVIDGETGFLVPEYDYHSMAAKMKVLAESPSLRERFGKNGRKNIIQLCSPETRDVELKRLLKP